MDSCMSALKYALERDKDARVFDKESHDASTVVNQQNTSTTRTGHVGAAIE
jgi:hypothetical protein